MFKNREDAGKKLADKLGHLKGENLLVLAIPRGGVVIGKVLSQELSCPLDVLVVKKIGAPNNPELAVGAMGPDEKAVWNQDILQSLNLKPEDLREEVQSAKCKVQSYNSKFKVKNLNLKDKIVILTDDGIATGATVEAALHFVQGKLPKRVVLAIPVAPPEIVEKFKKLVDELIVLEQPVFFGAVGQFYESFPQIEDEEVVKLLQ